ncbi:nucleotidyltransferase family protein [Stutzerimonas sp. VN223-3]|uniref:nucleotidyltransferase family protein n=1 Tax=Stutzerimonas sp. VN223-3 TaxID=3384601 RepID=UPI0038B4786A
MRSEANGVIGLVLAAGQARRFGADKRLARLSDGHGVLETTLRVAASVFSELVLVLRSDDQLSDYRLPPNVRVVHAARAEHGMGASLADGVTAIHAQPARAIAVLLGDMPWISTATLAQLAQAATEDGIVQPCHMGRPGHPVLFGRQFWPQLRALDGDKGGSALIARHPTAHVLINVTDPGSHLDVDVPSDLASAPEPAGFHTPASP